jgi:nucleotide-binding universal stress UspA family protein
MFKLKKILFPTDFSRCADQALAHAVFYAEKYNAELHLLHIITLFTDQPDLLNQEFSEIDDMIQKMELKADRQMVEVIHNHSSDKLKIIKTCKRAISAAPAILEYASENDIDMIVMGTHGRRGLGHLFLGSVAEEVVRMALCPVFTLRETEEIKPIKAYDKILVPVDFSEHSGTALSYAKRIADAYDAQLQVLHVIEETMHPAFSLAGKTSIFDLVPTIKDDSRNRIEKMLTESNGPEVKSEIFITGGKAAPEIIKFARMHNSDLIVISTHGLTGLDHFLLGSVTEKVVRRVHCPVFTVRTFGKSLI